MNCRFCKTKLKYTFVNLGASPLANSYIKEEQLYNAEPFYPLHAYVCDNCFLVQLAEFESPQHIFGDYAYFSSYSESFLNHAKNYTRLMVERFGFDRNSLVVEVASNDGYLLQYFKEMGVPVLGIEPAENVAKVAQDAGIPTIGLFFGTKTAQKLASEEKHADLMIGNNVLAHVPDLNDFVAGFRILLKPRGIVTMEFPHLLQLMECNLFDTIYHEHFSYFSFTTVQKVFAENSLTLFDVQEIPTHGGSLRIYACHSSDPSRVPSDNVRGLLEREKRVGLTNLQPYLSYGEKVRRAKLNILDFFIHEKAKGRIIAGYGAPAKANTLLNYCGIGTDLVEYTVDRSPHKQAHYLPGSRIPIYPPDKVAETKPDYLVIFPWNLKDEIMNQMSHIRQWGGKFVVLVPEVKVY